jgi:hypothetical protein
MEAGAAARAEAGAAACEGERVVARTEVGPAVRAEAADWRRARVDWRRARAVETEYGERGRESA